MAEQEQTYGPSQDIHKCLSNRFGEQEPRNIIRCQIVEKVKKILQGGKWPDHAQHAAPTVGKGHGPHANKKVHQQQQQRASKEQQQQQRAPTVGKGHVARAQAAAAAAKSSSSKSSSKSKSSSSKEQSEQQQQHQQQAGACQEDLANLKHSRQRSAARPSSGESIFYAGVAALVAAFVLMQG
jgi:cobalamin biosynthesis Mg chelatase CobN